MLCGLELVVGVGNNQLTRRIAGWDPSRPERPLKEAIAETRGALLGSHLLQFEGPSPPTSVLLDGIVTELLALEPIAHALEAGDEAIMRLLANGVPIRPPHELALAARELPLRADGEMLTYEVMPRMVLVSEYIPLESDQRLTRIDQLPLPNLHTVGSDPKKVFARTLVNSSGLAIAESALGDLSTFGTVGSGPLMLLSKNAVAKMDGERKAYWSRTLAANGGRRSLLVAPNGKSQAPYYAVDSRGQLFALLADGSGGAEAAEKIRQKLKEIDEVLRKAAAVRSMAGLSPAYGILITWGRLMVALYGAATIAITMMDNSGVDEAVRRALASAACDIVKGALLKLFGPVGRAFAGLDLIVGSFAAKVGQRNPFSCW